MSDFEMWMGSEKSYKETKENLDKISLASSDTFDPTDYNLMSVHEGVAIIDVSGHLVTSAPAFATMFGVLGYNVLKDTLVMAAQDAEVKHILLNIDSAGGSANGIDAVSELIKNISSTHKPVTAFTDTKAHSAAYWIAAATDSISATRMADVGSIGVISVLTEYTKAMEKDGVTATVMRSGEFKALGSSMEVLTPQAKSVIQGKLDQMYNEFTAHISSSRSQLPTDTTIWAEGKTFMGIDAIKVGLIDTVTTFEDLTSSLVKKVSASNKDSGRMRLSTEEPEMAGKRKILDEQAVAILASGGSIEATMGILDTVEDVAKVVEAVAEKIVEVIEDIKDDEPAVAVKSDMIDYFKAELSAANEKLVLLAIENREMKTKLESIDVTHTQLRAIAADAINLRSVGLGRGPTDLSTASDEVLLSTFSNISKAFNNTFPVGGVTDAASTERENSAVDDYDYEALKAARI